jgi:chloramphenicol O-acetyltransferase
MRGLIELDRTELRRMLREREAAGQPLPFTTALMYARRKAVDEDRIMHAYRRRNQIILFDKIDITQLKPAFRPRS